MKMMYKMLVGALLVSLGSQSFAIFIVNDTDLEFKGKKLLTKYAPNPPFVIRPKTTTGFTAMFVQGVEVESLDQSIKEAIGWPDFRIEWEIPGEKIRLIPLIDYKAYGLKN